MNISFKACIRLSLIAVIAALIVATAPVTIALLFHHFNLSILGAIFSILSMFPSIFVCMKFISNEKIQNWIIQDEEI
jgi:hypothetical protein